jgi:hypothetical protein
MLHHEAVKGRSNSSTRPTRLIARPSPADEIRDPLQAAKSLQHRRAPPPSFKKRVPKFTPRRRKRRLRRLSSRRCTPDTPHARDTRDSRAHIRARHHDGLRHCQVEGHSPTRAFPTSPTLPHSNIRGRRNKRFAMLGSLILSSQTKDVVTDAAAVDDKLCAALGGTLSLETLLAAEEHAWIVADCIIKVNTWRRETQSAP